MGGLSVPISNMNYIQRTIDLARDNVKNGGRPFACVIVKDGRVLAEAVNQVAQSHDPTAHAEILAIREGSKKLGSEDFTGCDFYVLAHPCPMCLAALYYCSPERVIFLSTREDYSAYYVDDRKYFTLDSFYGEFAKDWKNRALPMEYKQSDEAILVYRDWMYFNNKK
jgi:guanine deaminase